MPSTERRLLRRAATGVVVMLFACASQARAQQPIAGYVKIVSGAASVVRAGQEQPLILGFGVLPGDSLKTGADGRVGVTLKDDTRVSLGPNTEIAVASFAYAPTEGQLGFVMRVVRGAVSYISGRIARILAVVDVHDALVEPRPYRGRVPHEVAVTTIVEGRGTQFDPDVIEAFLSVEREFQQQWSRLQTQATTGAESVGV
jgi:hypothetical protein